MGNRYDTVAYLVLNHDNQLEPHVDIFKNGYKVKMEGLVDNQYPMPPFEAGRYNEVEVFQNAEENFCGLYCLGQVELEGQVDLDKLKDQAQHQMLESWGKLLFTYEESELRGCLIAACEQTGFDTGRINDFFDAVKEFEKESVRKHYMMLVRDMSFEDYEPNGMMNGARKPLILLVH